MDLTKVFAVPMGIYGASTAWNLYESAWMGKYSIMGAIIIVLQMAGQEKFRELLLTPDGHGKGVYN